MKVKQTDIGLNVTGRFSILNTWWNTTQPALDIIFGECWGFAETQTEHICEGMCFQSVSLWNLFSFDYAAVVPVIGIFHHGIFNISLWFLRIFPKPHHIGLILQSLLLIQQQLKQSFVATVGNHVTWQEEKSHEDIMAKTGKLD